MPWSRMVDMEMDDEDQLEAVAPIPLPERSRYPYGLRICLTEKELDKLGLEPDCSVGDVIDLRAFATVTDVHASETTAGGHSCRIELQIEKLSVEAESGESMDDEEEE